MWTWLQRYLPSTTAHSKGPDDRLGLEHTHTFLFIYLSTYVFTCFHGTFSNTWKQWKGVCIKINLIPCFRKSTFSCGLPCWRAELCSSQADACCHIRVIALSSLALPSENSRGWLLLSFQEVLRCGDGKCSACSSLCLTYTELSTTVRDHNCEGLNKMANCFCFCFCFFKSCGFCLFVCLIRKGQKV